MSSVTAVAGTNLSATVAGTIHVALVRMELSDSRGDDTRGNGPNGAPATVAGTNHSATVAGSIHVAMVRMELSDRSRGDE